MGKNRTKNALRNILFGFILKFFQIFLPFFMRTVMIYTLGVEYLGLNSLFVSILQILNLSDLGFTQAMTYSMYRPLAENDRNKINDLLSLYRYYYFNIGLGILFFGILLIPFLSHFIMGEIPENINIYVLYGIYLTSTVLSYWMFSYKSCLLEANQRNDVISKINLITTLMQFILQLIVLLIWKNYYLYIVIQIIVQIATQLLILYYVHKMYPIYQPSKSVNKGYSREITTYVKDLATAKFGAVILNSSDTIVISSFLGLSVLAIYQNYYLLITSVIGFVSTILYGTLPGIGNSIITDSLDKVYSDFKFFSFVISWIVGIGTCCFLNLFQPFMFLWVGEQLMLEFSIVILLCVYFYIYEFNQLFNVYKDAAGLWRVDRFRPLITSMINLVLNIMLVQSIGLYGIILSTIISIMFIGIPWLLKNLFNSLFKKNIKEYLIQVSKYVIITLLSCFISYKIGERLNDTIYFSFILKLLLSVLIPSIMYFICFNETEEFRKIIMFIKQNICSFFKSKN